MDLTEPGPAFVPVIFILMMELLTPGVVRLIFGRMEKKVSDWCVKDTHSKGEFGLPMWFIAILEKHFRIYLYYCPVLSISTHYTVISLKFKKMMQYD